MVYTYSVILEAQNPHTTLPTDPRNPNATTAAAGESTPGIPKTNPSAAGNPLLVAADVDASISSTVSGPGAAPTAGESTNTAKTRTPGHTEKKKAGKVLSVKKDAPITGRYVSMLCFQLYALEHSTKLVSRNLAAMRWKKDNPDGLDKELTAHWKLVSEGERKVSSLSYISIDLTNANAPHKKLEKEAKDLVCTLAKCTDVYS